VKGDRLDYFGLDGYTNEQLRAMGYVVWMPVQPKGAWLGEGDNHTFMNMLGNGLRAYENASYGGWGGKGITAPGANPFGYSGDTSQQAMVSAISSIGAASNATNTYPAFFPAAQNDFAARLKWAVTPVFKNANHEPVVRIEGPLHIFGSPGETLRLNGKVTDPDNNKLITRWWQFAVGTYAGNITIANENAPQTKITIPGDVKPGQTIHMILEATDDGSPALTRYQRVIITIRNK